MDMAAGQQYKSNHSTWQGNPMNSKSFSNQIIILLFIALCWTLSAIPAFCQTGAQVAVIGVRLVSDQLAIEKTTIQYAAEDQAKRTKPSSDHPYLAEILDIEGNVLLSKGFDFSRYMTIPAPLDADTFNPEEAVVRIENPMAVVVLPYSEDAATVRVREASKLGHFADMSLDLAIVKANGPASDKSTPGTKTPSESGKFNILVVASGYAAEEMSSFNASAQAVINELKGLEPFSNYSDNINYNTFENTQDLGCYTGCYGIDRLLCCDQSKVVSQALSSGQNVDEIIVIHNTTTYSGGGYRDPTDEYYKTDSLSTMTTVYDGCAALPSIATHEFGHSFGNLCDEYSYGTEGYTYQYCVNCRPDCSDFGNTALGCNQGCDARSDYFRPEASIMLDYSHPYYNGPSINQSLAPRLDYYIPQGPDQDDTLFVHRFTSKGSGSYFFTNSTGEVDYILENLSKIYDYDGIKFRCHPELAEGTTPLYRLYNKINGTHFYSALKSDRDWILESLGDYYDDEGVMCYVESAQSPDSLPAYRIYQSCQGFHWYTSSGSEKKELLADPCAVDEGTAFYVLPPE